MNDARYSTDLPAVASRRSRWLPALEKELKLRIGWVNETVSPFKRGRKAERAKSRSPAMKRA